MVMAAPHHPTEIGTSKAKNLAEKTSFSRFVEQNVTDLHDEIQQSPRHGSACGPVPNPDRVRKKQNKPSLHCFFTSWAGHVQDWPIVPTAGLQSVSKPYAAPLEALMTSSGRWTTRSAKDIRCPLRETDGSRRGFCGTIGQFLAVTKRAGDRINRENMSMIFW
jgi:hypothetical protein